VDDPGDQTRRSALPWPAPVRAAPGRWTVLASAALMVAAAVTAVVIVMVWM
jgi:hypothetical protein